MKNRLLDEFLTQDCYDFCLDRFKKEYGLNTEKDFIHYLKRYKKIKDFRANENINDQSEKICKHSHFILRSATQFYLSLAFKAMKIDMLDKNIAQNSDEGNIGTPGRIAKIWCGCNLFDDRELGGGRFAKKPRLATFPNPHQDNNLKMPITKKVDIISNCSHHFVPFSSIADPKSYALISYFPNNFVLGISKLQRITDWICQRFWLQEDLTKKLFDEVSKAAKTKSVFVKLYQLRHGCETFRGSKSNEGSFTTEYYDGKFANQEFRPKD